MNLTPTMSAKVAKSRKLFMDDEDALDLLGKIKFYYTPTDKDKKKAQKLVKKHHANVMALPPEVTRYGRWCRAKGEFMFPIEPTSSINIRPIELACKSPYPQEVIDKWAFELPRLIEKELGKQGYQDVHILDPGEEPSVGVVLTLL